MHVIDKVKEHLPECSKNERKIAEHILRWPYDFSRLSCEAICQKIGVSRSSAIRYFHKLGYNGYNEFRYALMSSPEDMQSTEENSIAAVSALACYDECLHKLENVFTPAEVTYLTDKLIHANRLFSYGWLHGSVFAEQIAFRLKRSGIDCNCINDPSILDCYTTFLKPGDVIMVTSVSHANDSLIQPALQEFRKRRVTLILLTMDCDPVAATVFDHITYLPSAIYSNSRFLLDEAVPFFLAAECIVEGVHQELSKNNQLPENL